ncbi:MAG TPA: hypothetical protein DCE23_02250 [Firmicutes bacterium]|nr:hypothetical protein [Bacillota bacterium]
MVRKNNITKILLSFFAILLIFTSYPIYGDDLNEEEDIDIFSEIDNTLTEETSSNTNTNTLNLNSRSCVVIDRLSKNILYGKNETNQVKMASTTKIMTAIVVLENSSLDETVEVSQKASNTGGSRLGLKTGDKITIRDLLYGLMLRSGNDAAVCLAETVAGSIEEFASLMNAKTQELGLSHTHFESPHGLDSDEHYTTAYELALLSDYALKNPTFLNIVGTKNYTVTINGYPKVISNTNELLGNLDGVYGIKTGFTNGANRCLVTACKRGDMDIICVVLGADTKNLRTKDSIKLIEYAFKNFEYVNISERINKEFTNWKNENQNYFNINKGLSSNLEIKYSELKTPIIPMKKSDIKSIEVNIYVTKNFEAPLYENTLIGSIEVTSDNSSIVHCDILASNTVQKKNFFDYTLEFLKNYPYFLNSSIS